MKKEFRDYVVIVSKSEWSCIETAKSITGVSYSIEELNKIVPKGSMIMPRTRFFAMLNAGGYNPDLYWAVQVGIEQTWEAYCAQFDQWCKQ